MEIKDLLSDKVKFQGVASLADDELLSLVIGRGAVSEEALAKARELLKSYGDVSSLFRSESEKVRRQAEFTPLQATLMAAVREICVRGGLWQPDEADIIRNNGDVERIFMPLLSNLPHEEFWLLCLNTSHRVVDMVRIGQGGVSGVMVDVRLVMRKVLDKLASAIILVHNHPSGSFTPSREDISLTEKIEVAAGLFDIQLLDHVIITKTGASSIKK